MHLPGYVWPRLVVLAGPLCGEAFPLDAPGTTVGRDTAADLSIPDPLISRRHFALAEDDGRVVLRDLGSSNGTFVNAAPARERVLEHGDRIRAGDSLFLYLRSEGTDPARRTPPDEADDRTVRIDPRAGVTPGGSGDTSLDAAPASGRAGRTPLVHAMVGDSPLMRAVFDRIRKAAPADSTVLVLGETGTGKELAARAIHDNSPRARGPFLAVNCAALTEPLLESELFGHERGAFTGAVALKRGKLEVAHGGTLFLDEIGELAPALQAKLLRVLQRREFERVGGTRTMRVDVR